MNTIKCFFFLFTLVFTLNSNAQRIKKIIDINASFRKDTTFTFKSDKNETYIPVVILKGKETGPVFSIVAGIHGYEYPPIVAVQELISEIEIDRLKGTLIIAPIANVESFYRRRPFVNPIDNKNLNNAFPGSKSGTITDQLADFITTEIIDHTNIFLDIHGGDASEDLLPFVCYYDRKDTPQQTAKAKELAEQSGFDPIVSYPYNLKATDAAKYAFKEATQKGIIALSIEAGKLGNVQQNNVESIKTAVYQMLAKMKMYGLANQREKKPLFLNNQVYVSAPKTGIFFSKFKSGDKVIKGQELGYITDEFGKKKVVIVADESGIILYKIGTPPVNGGETLFCFGVKEKMK